MALLHGTAANTVSESGRGFQAVQRPAAAPHAAGYSHPFYWAPFVLIGNYQ
jgi:CHAT domain-containing protein